MFLHTVRIERITPGGDAHPVPVRQIDSFCMRYFTNDAVFDDTLPVSDGILEIGSSVPVDHLQRAMQDWFRRKQYLQPGETLCLTPFPHTSGT